MKSITSKYAKERIYNLSKDITKYWHIIQNENVISKEAKRNYDLKVLLTKIEEMAEERFLMKLYLQCINMGYNNYITIFSLSEKQERLNHLNRIKTIDPKLKRAKGKKALNNTEELTSAFIGTLKNKLQLEINKLTKDLEDFNEKAELDIESVPICLAA